MAPRGKIVRSTAAQIKLLVDYMSTNPLFAAGEFTGPLGAQQNEEEWSQLQRILAEAGPDKTVTQWKHTWRDLKKKAREDAERARMAALSTGNLVPVPDISENSKKILGTIGRECAVGISVEEETGIVYPIVIMDQNDLDSDPPPPPPRAEAHVSTDRGGGTVPSVPRTARAAARPRPRRRAAARSRRGDVQQYLAALNQTNKHIQELVAEIRMSNRLARSSKTRSSAFRSLSFN